MKSQTLRVFSISSIAILAVCIATPAQSAKGGKLKMRVQPSEAYTFVDGNAIGPGNRTVKVSAGTHHVMVANYGFQFAEQDVTVDSGRTVPLKIELQHAGAPVSGPHGRIQLEPGLKLYKYAAVLLNGKTPRYFVGHVDEFNNDIVWHQELVVPPGTHQITVTRYGKELWSGAVTVAADERVIVNVSNGKQKTKHWARGSTQLAAEIPRFQAGAASATVVIAPVTGTLAAAPQTIDCGRPAQLTWTSNETIDADMSGMSPVPTSGERSVSPRQTTTYQLTATGPGGVVTPSTTVAVNTAVQSSLSASPQEVKYRRIGDKLVQQEDTTLAWSSSNADSTSIATVGAVEPNGTKSVSLVPSQAENGPVSQDVTYTFTASNVCGGTATKTATVRITGSIEGIPQVLLRSIFFPTDYPTKKQPSLGLVASQQEALKTLAAGFTKYLEYDPGARIALSSYTDVRGTSPYNQTLSELRAQNVKDFLVSQGVAADKIDTAAYGKQKPLDKPEVAALQAQNPNPPTKNMKQPQTAWLAHNRRVDIVLLPTNAESVRFYPNEAADSPVLSQRDKPSPTEVEKSQ